MEKELLNKLKYLINKKKDLQTICEELELKDYEVIGLIELMKQDGELVDYVNGQIVKLKKPTKSDEVYKIPNALEHLKLLLIRALSVCFYFSLSIRTFPFTVPGVLNHSNASAIFESGTFL